MAQRGLLVLLTRRVVPALAVVAAVLVSAPMAAAGPGEPPEIVEQPQDVVTRPAQVSFRSSVSGPEFGVRAVVEFSTDNGVTWDPVGGCGSCTNLQVGPFPVDLSDNGLRVRFVWTNAFGSTTSRIARLTVCETAPACPIAPLVEPAVGEGNEGDTGMTTVEVPVTLSTPSTATVTAEWTTLFVPAAPGDQADPATDYAPASGTVTFEPGETSQTVSIPVDGDQVIEPDEYVVVSFHDPANAEMGGFWGLGFAVIDNDD